MMRATRADLGRVDAFVKRLGAEQPELVVDCATLTGAAGGLAHGRVALLGLRRLHEEALDQPGPLARPRRSASVIP